MIKITYDEAMEVNWNDAIYALDYWWEAFARGDKAKPIYALRIGDDNLQDKGIVHGWSTSFAQAKRRFNTANRSGLSGYHIVKIEPPRMYQEP